jgi:hypothetical protein
MCFINALRARAALKASVRTSHCDSLFMPCPSILMTGEMGVIQPKTRKS